MSGLSTSCLAVLITNTVINAAFFTHTKPFVLVWCKICLQIELFFTPVFAPFISVRMVFPIKQDFLLAVLSLQLYSDILGQAQVPLKIIIVANLCTRMWNFGKHETGQDLALVSLDSLVSTAEKPSGTNVSHLLQGQALSCCHFLSLSAKVYAGACC